MCSDCVPPNTAAIASMVVRTTLFIGSCSVRLAPEVWQCVRSISDSARFGANSFRMRSAQMRRPARIFAISR